MPLTSSERFALLTDYSKFETNFYEHTHILLITKKVTNKNMGNSVSQENNFLCDMFVQLFL